MREVQRLQRRQLRMPDQIRRGPRSVLVAGRRKPRTRQGRRSPQPSWINMQRGNSYPAEEETHDNAMKAQEGESRAYSEQEQKDKSEEEQLQKDKEKVEYEDGG